MQQAVLRQVALRQRLPGSRHRRKALVPGPLPSGRLALPRSQRLTAHPAPPRLVPFLGCGRPHAAPLPAFRTAGRRHAPRDRPLQGLRTDVRALRRTALHRRVRCVGHRLQDRPLEYLAARQLVPTLGRDDARQHDGRRGAGRTDHAHGRGEIRRQPRAGDVRTARRGRRGPLALHPHRLAERRRLAVAARTGHFGHRGRPFVVPDPERTGLRLGLQRRTHPARIRNRPQHGHPGRTGRAAGADPRNHRTHPRRRPLVARNRQSSADPLQTPLYARKADGLDYDPEDERQQHFLAEITKYNLRSID